MNTKSTAVSEGTGNAQPDSPAPSTARFDYTMLGLAAVFLVTLTAAASILITLPEALEAVSAPAFGAPWITSSSHASPESSEAQAER